VKSMKHLKGCASYKSLGTSECTHESYPLLKQNMALLVQIRRNEACECCTRFITSAQGLGNMMRRVSYVIKAGCRLLWLRE
jgi:hypothetical protein